MAEQETQSGAIRVLKKFGVYTFWFLFLLGLAASTVGILNHTSGSPARPDLGMDHLIGGVPGRLSVLVATNRQGTYHVMYEKNLNWEAQQPSYLARGLDDMFAALAVSMLHERGNLDVAKPLGTYLPKYAGFDELTVEHLLTHTSGIQPAWTEIPEGAVLQPGAGTYAALNFQLLRELVALTANMPYQQFVQSQIFAELELGITWDQEARDWRVNPTDLGIFENWLNSNRLVGLPTHLRAQSAAILPDGSRGDYGYGWQIKNFKGLRMERVLVKEDHFNGLVLRFPEKNFSTILLYEGPASEFDCEAIGFEAAMIYLGRERPFRDRPALLKWPWSTSTD